jgi:hypothetical protein
MEALPLLWISCWNGEGEEKQEQASVLQVLSQLGGMSELFLENLTSL